MKDPITKEQVKGIKAATSSRLSDDEYREMLHGRYNVTSCTQLTCREASELISLFVTWGWFPAKKQHKTRRNRVKNPLPRQKGNMTRIASQAQHKKIGALSDLIEWRVKDGFTLWIAKRFSIDRVRTAQQAWQVIEGLKKMFENQMKAAYGPKWRDVRYDDADIRRYMGEH